MSIKNLITHKEKVFILDSIDTFFSLHLNVKQQSIILFGSVNKLSKNVLVYICSKHTRECNELYLRCGNFEDSALIDIKQIIIARISFIQKFQRCGKGVLLLMKICEIARKFNYEVICFEAPNEDCQAFASRLGFDKENWSIDRERLITNLQKYLKNKLKKSD